MGSCYIYGSLCISSCHQICYIPCLFYHFSTDCMNIPLSHSRLGLGLSIPIRNHDWRFLHSEFLAWPFHIVLQGYLDFRFGEHCLHWYSYSFVTMPACIEVKLWYCQIGSFAPWKTSGLSALVVVWIDECFIFPWFYYQPPQKYRLWWKMPLHGRVIWRNDSLKIKCHNLCSN